MVPGAVAAYMMGPEMGPTDDHDDHSDMGNWVILRQAAGNAGMHEVELNQHAATLKF